MLLPGSVVVVFNIFSSHQLQEQWQEMRARGVCDRLIDLLSLPEIPQSSV